jgi:hypothetical protein
MSDGPKDQTDDYADITALLAGSQQTGPLPAEVAARLDATLADLTADWRRAMPAMPEVPGATAAEPDPSIAVPLSDSPIAPLRRRRHAPQRLLVAAAAVLVVAGAGVGITKALEHSSTETSSSSTADSGSSHANLGLPAPQAPTASATGDTTSTAGGATLDKLDQAAGSDGRPLPALTTAAFAAGAEQLVRTTEGAQHLSATMSDSGSAVRGASPETETTPAPNSASKSVQAPTNAAPPACVGPTGTDGDLEPITLDGTPAVLVISPITNHHQLVQAWSCDGSTVLASATLTP